ncbi:unnamed protein product [Caenorhabditis bovis]|uniref:Cytochrome b561 domain-containing protein n=1 Tax=Caenorhabditis bovis TaxID=2654633 RepID=A0A8S1E433_9PELO|nr:unnamed protein product [Caenorhabditis bovis]
MPPNLYESRSKSSNTYFEVILAVTHFFGFITILLNGFFFNSFENGLAWPTKNRECKGKGDMLHGFLMILAFIFFQGEALLCYRVYRYNAKIISKLIHTFLHGAAIGLGLTSLVVIIINNNIDKEKHFSTVHSWIGVIILLVYNIQFVFGFLTFLFPCTPGSYRARLIPLHRAVGASCMILACIQCTIGHVQRISWHGPDCYMNLSCPNRLEYVLSFAILTMILYTLLVIGLIVPQNWKRVKTPDELK